MTPLEKAQDLFDKFKGKYHDVRDGAATQSAIICCDEVMLVIIDTAASIEPLKFWEEVKDILKKEL
jgi:hypothetical protein